MGGIFKKCIIGAELKLQETEKDQRTYLDNSLEFVEDLNRKQILHPERQSPNAVVTRLDKCEKRALDPFMQEVGHQLNLDLVYVGPGVGFRSFGEFRTQENCEKFLELGQPLTSSCFEVGQTVYVKGTAVGKGFMGNQKRHKFSRGPMTHGSKNHRLPGAIGAGSTPARVYPGKRMAGRISNKNVKVKTEILFI